MSLIPSTTANRFLLQNSATPLPVRLRISYLLRSRSLLECGCPEAVTRFSPGHEHPVVQTGVLSCFLVSTGPPAYLPGSGPAR